MLWQPCEPQYRPDDIGAVAVLEAVPGARRQAALDNWLRQVEAAGGDTWRLECAPESGGVWAGLADLIESLMPQVRQAAPDLVAAHGYEISLVLPRYEGQLEVSRPLTDTTAPEERTRNHPADRAYRSLHGLIEMVSEWHARCGGRTWAVACDHYDRANGLVQRFFRELDRRRGCQIDLHLLVAVEPGRGQAVAAGFGPRVGRRFRPGWEGADAPVADPDAMAAEAAALEAVVQPDVAGHYVELPRLVHLWQHSTQPERAQRWQVSAMSVLNHRGLYEASLEYADAVEASLDQIPAGDSRQLHIALSGIYFSRVTLGQAERAREVIERSFARLDPEALLDMYYLVAMLYTRFLGSKNLDKAEEYLERALGLLCQVDLPEDDRQFMTVFLNNGLALVRVRQQRPQEALALCQAGIQRLRQYLAPNRHQLHHSVLLYNIAQVYAQIGPYEKALDYFGQTMAMDPNYSEYYNDRGAVYFKMGRLLEAEADFQRAIALSPPYAEVWVNLGQCLRAQGRMADAVAAYSRALDLEPESALAWTGRADAQASLGWTDEALEDFGEALRLDPSQALVWAGRAIVCYERGQVWEALGDLDRAVALAPDLGELRQNRAVALQDIGRLAEAAADLERYLELCPDAPDRAEVKGRLESLLVGAP